MWKYFASFLIVFFIQISPIYAQYTCLPIGNYEDLPYWRADLVFTGAVEKVSAEDISDEKETVVTTDNPPKLKNSVVKLSIEKKYRGIIDQTVEINTTSSFKEGEKYFVYVVRGKDGKFYKIDDGVCGKSPILLKDAAEDVEYAEDIASGNSGTRIYGRVYQDKQDSFRTPRQNIPLPDIEVTIKNKTNSFSAKTDDNGKYIFKNIPIGAYQISAFTPNGMREREIKNIGLFAKQKVIFIGEGFAPNQLILLNSKEKPTPFYYHSNYCNFVFTSLSSIEKKIIGFNGKQPPQQYLSLLPIDENGKVLSDFLSFWTHKTNGNFLLDAVPAGKYLLSVNPKNCPYQTTPESPRETNAEFGRMFFNGTENESEAKIIEVKEGEEIKLGKFRLSPPLKERWFSGVVLNADKTPAVNAIVRLTDAYFGSGKCSNFNAEIKTDEFGKFLLKGFETYEYKIEAYGEKKNYQRQTYAKHQIITNDNKADDIQLILYQSF